MPSDFALQRQEAVRKRNELNKRRAKSMELRVAKILEGKRVPMSGSGQLKGDGMVYCELGLYLFECKHSSMLSDRTLSPRIRLQLYWLEKIEEEARAMRARFGILVIHYHGEREDFVFINESFWPILQDTPQALSDLSTIRCEKRGLYLDLDVINSKMLESRSMPAVRFVTSTGNKYIILTLQRFKEIVDERTGKTQA